MTLLIVIVCTFANQTAKLPQHVGSMSWHQAKFHYFHACFGFTGIKKLSFSMFPTQPRRPEFWISFPFLAWNLEIYPRTHMRFFNQLWCTGTCACISNLNYAHKGDTPSQNHEPSWEKLRFARSLYQNLFLFGQFFLPRHGTTMTWHHAKFHDFKTKFLNVLDRATMPRCLNFILIFCMGPTPSFHLYRA